MHVVTVSFEIEDGRTREFMAAMLEQARNSLAREADCRQFDVCVDPSDRRRVFLYEIYTDQAAFQAHLESRHFRAFDRRVKNWLISKKVESWERLEAAAAVDPV